MSAAGRVLPAAIRTDIAKRHAVRWHDMSDDRRATFNAEAEDEKERKLQDGLTTTVELDKLKYE